MEKKIFKFVYKKAEKVFLYLMFAFFVFTTILNLCKLLQLFSLVSYDVPFDIFGLILSILLGAFIITTLNKSKYTIVENALIEEISIFKKKIDCSQICKVLYHDTAKILYIFYTNEKKKQTYLKINILNSDIDDFVKSLKECNSSIVYELTGGK